MPAITVSLTRLNGFPNFHCFHCGAVILGEDGPVEEYCQHVLVFWDPHGDPELGPAAADDLEDKLDEIEAAVPEKLASRLGDDTIVFELVEQSRGGGHDEWVCLVALVVDPTR